MSTFKVFFNVALLFLFLVHPSVQQPKLIDLNVLDVSSRTLQRIEHLLTQLLDIVSKAVPFHRQHIQLLSKQIASENMAPKQPGNIFPQVESQPKPSIVVDVSRKSFLSRLHELENSLDNANMNPNNNNANVNANTNINTNSNSNFNVRKHPTSGMYMNDDLI